MYVAVSDHLFADESRWPELIVLLHHAVRQRCYVGAQNPNSAAFATWFAQLSRTLQQAWTDAVSWSLRDRAIFRMRTWLATVHTSDNGNSPQFELSALLNRLQRPMHIWVENDRNDRRFLLSVLPPSDAAMIMKLEQRNVIQFDSRGGLGELRVSLAERFERGEVDRHNSYVFFDSDAGVPGKPSADADAMQTLCDTLKFPHHCLSRRAIENYLPKAALYGWAASHRRSERAPRIDAFFRMSADQRNHFRMKVGWDTRPSTEVATLYASVSIHDRDALQRGIANDIADLYGLYGDKIWVWLNKEGGDPALDAALLQLLDWIRVPYA